MKKRTADYSAGIKDTLKVIQNFIVHAGPSFSMVLQRTDGMDMEYSVTLDTVKQRPKPAKITIPVPPDCELMNADELKIIYL